MTRFGGPAFRIDRDNINTDEIIPARYLTESSKIALQPHLLEDLLIDGKKFDNSAPELQQASVLISRKNFGCGSSREHAVWVLEVNDISVVIAESFARIFRQNMYNCGMMAIALPAETIERLFSRFSGAETRLETHMDQQIFIFRSADHGEQVPFDLTGFDRELVKAGGWVEYADGKY